MAVLEGLLRARGPRPAPMMPGFTGRGGLRARGPRPAPMMRGFTGRGGPSKEARARYMVAIGHSPIVAKRAAEAGVMLGQLAPARPTAEEEAERAGAVTEARLEAEAPYREAEAGVREGALRERRGYQEGVAEEERGREAAAEAKRTEAVTGLAGRLGFEGPAELAAAGATAGGLLAQKRLRDVGVAREAEEQAERAAETQKAEDNAMRIAQILTDDAETFGGDADPAGIWHKARLRVGAGETAETVQAEMDAKRKAIQGRFEKGEARGLAKRRVELSEAAGKRDAEREEKLAGLSVMKAYTVAVQKEYAARGYTTVSEARLGLESDPDLQGQIERIAASLGVPERQGRAGAYAVREWPDTPAEKEAKRRGP